MLNISASLNQTHRRYLQATLSLVVLSSALMAGSGHAQTSQTSTAATTPVTGTAKKSADATAKKPATKATTDTTTPSDDTTTVTVTAARPEVEHKVDRDVYDVKQDPISATGSAADVLNNVPAVTVDPDGTVQLRGNSNVQVYVNGKKSAQMSADNRGFTLQSLNGDDIDTVEVITNPTAEFGSDTSGGIINIVMKRGRALKPITSFNVVAGDRGRGNISANTGKTIGKLTLNASGSLNHGAGGDGGGTGSRGGRGGGFGSKSKGYSDRFRLDPTTGAVLREDQQTTVSKSNNNNASANLNAQYNVSDSTTLEGNFSYSGGKSTTDRATETVSYDGNHNLIGDNANLTSGTRDRENMQTNLIFDHRGQIGSAEDFKMQLSHSQSLNSTDTLTHYIYHEPVTPDQYYAQASKSKTYIDEFSGDWVHPFGETKDGGQQIKMGWDIQHELDDQYKFRSLNSAVPVYSPDLPRASAVSQYNVEQVLSAGYFIYQTKYKQFQAQVGVRVENLHQTMVSSNPVTNVTPTDGKYDNIFYAPSAILMYSLTDKQQIKLSYSEKLRRPSASELNPLVVLSDDGLTARSGNASLKPEKTDKYELSYTNTTQGFDGSVRMHYDSTTGSINTVSSYLTNQPNVLLYTYDNSGSRQETGVDFSLNTQTPDRKFRYSLNGYYNYDENNSIDYVTHLPIHTSGPSSNLSGRVTYRPTSTDTIVVGANYSGKNTQYQSYTTQVARMNISYVHHIIPNKMILTVNASNFLFGPTSKTYNETSTNRSQSYTFNPGASFMVSLRYTFGAVRAQRGDGPPRDYQRDGGPGGGRGGFGGGYGGGGGGGAPPM